MLRWYTDVGRDPLHPIAGLPHLRLDPADQTKSYDALPVDAIRNGALLVPGLSDQPDGEFWAMESTRERAERTQFQLTTRERALRTQAMEPPPAVRPPDSPPTSIRGTLVQVLF